MANGTVKPINQIKVGDKITNAVPGLSGTQAHTVSRVIVTTTDHDFVDVTVAPSKSDVAAVSSQTKTGWLAKTALVAATAVAVAVAPTTAPTTASDFSASGGTLTTTFHHPFYDQTQDGFVDAKDLRIGDDLQTDTGTTTVTSVRLYHTTQTTFDLTIDGLHTYYVIAGNTPVLVHNSNCFNPAEESKNLPEYRKGGPTSGRARASDGRAYDVVSGDKANSRDLLDIVNDRMRQAGRLPGRATSGTASDAEQKFAAIMWRDGIDDADMVINHPGGPCMQPLGCNDSLGTILGPTKTLTLHWHDPEEGWQMATYGAS
jgi:hypothetical protein